MNKASATKRAQDARKELAAKSLDQIQRETAVKWSWRGWAARRKAERTRSARRAARWTEDACEYMHEGVEHGGLALLEEHGGERFFAHILAIARDQVQPGVDASAALAELDAKDIIQIQRETALTWAWRAWAAYDYARTTTSRVGSTRWRSDAKAYAEEAAEHAALAEEDGAESVIAEVLGIIRSGM